MRQAACALALLVPVGLVCSERIAGAGADGAVTIETVDVSAFPEVSLTVSMPAGLASADAASFAVEENGTDRAVSVSRLAGDQLDVVIVVDTSASMQGAAIEAARTSALSFLDRLPQGSNTAVIGFGDAPTVVSGFTTDKQAAGAAISSLAARGETALYDALESASTVLATGSGNVKAMVLLSDGGDTVSASTLDRAIAAISSSGARFTAIGLTTEESDRQALDQMAVDTGGTVLAVEDPTALDGAYAAIASRLGNLYELRFVSGGARRADLRVVVDQDGFTAEVVKAVDYPAGPVGTTPTTAAEIVAPEPFVERSSGPPGGWLLGGGAALVGLGLVGLLVVALGREEPRRRLALEYDGAGVERSKGEGLHAVASRITSFTSGLLERRGQTGYIDAALDGAGLSVRAGEFVGFVAVSSITAAMVGYLLAGPFGLAAAMLPALLAPAVLATLRSRRRQQFADQLGEALLLLSGSLRAGFGLVQSVDSVARESLPPMSEEFSRVVVEMRLGRGMAEAFAAAADRVDSDDFRWVVDAIDIHREVGGDLAEVLDRVGDTIRDRLRSARQVRALSAEGRMSAAVLLLLPFAVGGLLAASSPDYLAELFGRTAGLIMLAVAGVLLVLGGVWLKRIIRPEF